MAFAPGDQEAQRAFHADDAARPLLAELVADGLGDGGAVVEGHVRLNKFVNIGRKRFVTP